MARHRCHQSRLHCEPLEGRFLLSAAPLIDVPASLTVRVGLLSLDHPHGPLSPPLRSDTTLKDPPGASKQSTPRPSDSRC